MFKDFYDDKTEPIVVQALCDFYGLTLYDFLETGDVLADSGYEVSGLAAANHDLGKRYCSLACSSLQ